MADSAGKDPASYPVRAIYDFFKKLEGVKTPDGKTELETFLAECDAGGLTLPVSQDLYEIGHKHFDRLIRVNAVGPDCPLCPSPPRL